MEARDYARIMARISPHEAEDLDDLLAPEVPRAERRGSIVFPQMEAEPPLRVPFRRADAVCVGFHVAPDAGRSVERAVRFAAMALERDVEVIVLADEDVCGLERFGFRVERLAGDGGRGACLDQLRRFWALDLVLRA